MNIEINEFYPIEHQEETDYISGTISVHIEDLKMNLLGIFVCRNKGKWNVLLPYKKGLCHKSDKSVNYPIVNFEPKERNRDLVNAIREQLPSFIERRLSDPDQPVVFPQRKQSVPKSKVEEKVRPKAKVWVDPPPLKRFETAHSMNKKAK